MYLLVRLNLIYFVCCTTIIGEIKKITSINYCNYVKHVTMFSLCIQITSNTVLSGIREIDVLVQKSKV